MTSIVALHRASIEDLSTWAEEIGGDTVILLDEGEQIYNLYKKDNARPQYIVIDRDMTVVYKASMPDGRYTSQDVVLELLESEPQ